MGLFIGLFWSSSAAALETLPTPISEVSAQVKKEPIGIVSQSALDLIRIHFDSLEVDPLEQLLVGLARNFDKQEIQKIWSILRNLNPEGVEAGSPEHRFIQQSIVWAMIDFRRKAEEDSEAGKLFSKFYGQLIPFEGVSSIKVNLDLVRKALSEKNHTAEMSLALRSDLLRQAMSEHPHIRLALEEAYLVSPQFGLLFDELVTSLPASVLYGVTPQRDAAKERMSNRLKAVYFIPGVDCKKIRSMLQELKRENQARDAFCVFIPIVYQDLLERFGPPILSGLGFLSSGERKKVLARVGIVSSRGGVDFTYAFVWSLAEAWNQIRVPGHGFPLNS